MSAILHTIGGLIFFGIVWAVAKVSPALAAFIAAGGAILLREVTQKQSAKYDNDFRKGWDLWTWDRDKQIETVVPIAIILVAASIIVVM